jgi:hypothetical protein
MDVRGRLKRLLCAGAAFGAALSVALSLLMDTLYGDALGGTWRDAIIHDLRIYLSISASKDSPIVIAVFMLILSVLAAFGAFMGLIFTFFVYRFFTFLQGK